jgi:predicted 2-oxoglutarate/Fe(II)-dependent dioxygenase YbiX
LIPKDVRSYAKLYKGFLDSDVCSRAVEQLKQAEWEAHTFYNVAADSRFSHDTDLDISYHQIGEYKTINERVWFAIEQYILKDFSDFNGWFEGWNGYTSVRFNRYDPKTEMKLHCDHIHSMFDGKVKGVPTLTVLGGLNDDYTGGEFVMWEDEVIELSAGDVLVFPANFMFPHEVRPVKSGIRYSYVSWVW